MKHHFLLAALLFVSAACHAVRTTASYQIVPLPHSVAPLKDAGYRLTASTGIQLADASLASEAQLFTSDLKAQTGIALSPQGRGITLQLNSKIAQDEGYRLTVRRKGITIEARTSAGIFYGLQCLRKAIGVAQADTVELPAVIIADHPRFGYRSMHFDSSRHFFSTKVVKQYIDMLALHQMNTLHWHLTDDQGWRIPIPGLPRLTEVSAWRTGTVIGQGTDLFDDVPHGGFYTRQELDDIVAYAQARHITIIPEIDMPGHMSAVLAAYPELGCTGGPYEVIRDWGIFPDILCAGRDETFRFVEKVLDEVMDIFPSKVIHIGGDEAPKDRWEVCPRCQQRIKELALKAPEGHKVEEALQGYFTRRVEQYVKQKGRTIMGWDEVLDGGVDTTTIVMSWRGYEGGLRASQLGYDVVMVPTDYCYFDYCQTRQTTLKLIGGYVPLSKIYSLDPAPQTLPADARQHILGAQANLWSEYLYAPQLLFYQALPRAAALSEVCWTPTDQKDYDQFKERVVRLEQIYKLMGLDYCPVME